ncbi:unnamed protein product [Acanthoscelides obtectus]|uniref:Uncharacterized protein n=1 Tax=Acanthoscelides obtectus TaxID=200917 RepID=A0A9P0PXI9_ACAOB|nr:unnamed protein product [Acanthoscelides obtectus]CAK1670903.1 hypothetical protein AOBTE_LOCUS27905 [Acanthoscelides obtectus]
MRIERGGKNGPYQEISSSGKFQGHCTSCNQPRGQSSCSRKHIEEGCKAI